VRTSVCVALFLSFSSFLTSFAAERPQRWIAILEDPPLAKLASSRGDVQVKALSAAASRIATKQQTLKSALRRQRGVHVTGSVDTLLNAVFFGGSDEAAAAVRKMPGVVRVVRQRAYQRHDARAADVVNASGAWANLGGDQNAGSGIKIAILDTGIDKNHPAFQDAGLAMPSGYPKCQAEYCDAYTSNKVVAARSYVDLLAVANDPTLSRPDDYSPRDRVGHGTAVASIAAGVRSQGPAAVVQGIAPKAYLGSYKVFGSPGVNDFALDEVVIRALDDAFNDGMDIASLSLGAPALWAPEDRDTDCGRNNVGPCDPQVDAVENAIRRGMIVVVDAGNSSEAGLFAPGLGTINTPGTAPSAITVGGSTNTHYYYARVRANGDGVPDNVKSLVAQLTNGLKPRGPLTATLIDVSTLNNNGLACSALPGGSLNGAIALIQRGDCEFAIKLFNAQNAGAIAVVFYQREGSNFLFPISNLKETGIPAVLIGNTDGKNLRTWIGANAGAQITIDPTLVELDGTQFANEVAYFSSFGPSIASLNIKPDLVAVATDLYMATQTYDPNGDMHDPSGYFASQGNSFAAAQVAGAAALIKQKYPTMQPAELKSALVTTANENVTDFDGGGNPYRARVVGIGGGRLDAGKATQTTVVSDTSSLSFGIPRNNAFPSRSFRLTNFGDSTVNLSLEVQQRDSDSRARVSLNNSSATLAPGQSQVFTASITGSIPFAGNYEGVIRVNGGSVPLRIPYLYLVGDNVPYNIIPLTGDQFVREPGGEVEFNLLVVDRWGVPVVGRRVDFITNSGGGRIISATNDTDGYGIALALAQTGNQVGYQEYAVRVGQVVYTFTGRNRPAPTLNNASVTSLVTGQPSIAAGALAVIKGVGLSESSQSYSTPYLPLSLSNVSVSFDDTSAKMGYAGRLVRVSEGEIVVQVPWEIEGRESVQTKVSIGYGSQTDLITVPVTRFAAGIFERTDSAGNTVALATDESGNQVGSENGVAAGSTLNLVVNGLGPVNSRPPSGEAPSNRDSTTHALPVVTIGGVAAEVQYSGLNPDRAGTYLVSVRVPAELGSGPQPVILKVDDVTAKTVNTVVR
jgi:minor extracellular serine protease Vpr